ncbi:MAG: P-II family nitrogen regulator [Gammaproteobacteria bacterium]|nr:MAG: P-II family nitrogen regulator [Gammaproteobacteria bacterium]
MAYHRVTAILRNEVLEKVEKRLEAMGVGGVSVTRVKGFGEYANFFSRECLVSHVQLDVFTEGDRSEAIVQAILEAVHTGLPGDGLVAVQPVETLLRIRTQAPPEPGEL